MGDKSMKRNLAIIAAVVLFICLVWLVALKFLSAKPTPPVMAMTQMTILRTQLEAFRVDTGSYPTGTNALRGLLRQPAGVANWHGPYAQDVPKDPWGRDYVYEYPGKHAGSGYPYDLLSLGPPGTSSPIANWTNPILKP